jgi:hypothetical protein
VPRSLSTRRAVADTLELQRVLALPRRVPTEADAIAWAEVLTAELRAPGSTAALRIWQAYALAMIAECEGGFIVLPVGFGKTLIMWLGCIMLGAQRPLVIVPGTALVDKTLDDFASYRGKWRTPNPAPRVITKESLQVESGADFLDDYRPDLILIDEGDEMANAQRGAPRRLDRYCVANPLVFNDAGEYVSGARYVVLTGTPARDSWMQVWHLLMWCLRERAPMPLDYGEAKVWSSALDAKGGENRAHWGALEALREPGDGPGLDGIRRAFQRRLAETPGVLVIDGDSCDMPLHIDIRPAREDAAIDAHYQAFIEHPRVSPGGIPVSDALRRFQLDSQLGCGYYSVQFDPVKREAVHAYMRTGNASVFSELERSLLRAAEHGMPERLIMVDTDAEFEFNRAALADLSDEEIAAGVRRQPFVPDARAMAEARAVLGHTAPVSDAVYAQCYELCRPPIMWRVARRAVAGFVRGVLERATDIDTERQVYRRYPRDERVVAWLEWKAAFEPESVVLWLSASAIESCVDWLRESPDPGIVWCGGVEFAQALAAATGLPYYGREGKDFKSGRTLHRADPCKSMIVSWNANKKGFNLQPWARQLVVQPPPSAKWIEQIIGRSHRSEQEKPVHVTLLATSGGVLDGFEATIAEAGFGKISFGPTQKVLRATITRAMLRSTPTNEFRWATRNQED